MVVAELVVYPIKSLRGVSVRSWQLEKRGLMHDRRWMLVDAEGVFLTQRTLHQMALFDVDIEPTCLLVRVGNNQIAVPLVPEGQARMVRVWNSTVEALTVSPAIDGWFSRQMELECSLVYMPESAVRPVASERARPDDIVGFADSNPVLVAGLESLADLNSRLQHPVPIRRFRTNVVLADSAPFEEDEWDEISIGEAILRRTKRCGRCVVTTIDIETAQPSQEPLRTLASYRTIAGSACFGSYYVPEGLGTMAVGDPVYVTSVV